MEPIREMSVMGSMDVIAARRRVASAYDVQPDVWVEEGIERTWSGESITGTGEGLRTGLTFAPEAPPDLSLPSPIDAG
ncbi:hypothetical protein PHSY_004189 [Pseudozyma hubeiensis SY62]|uniref:Uncharacterized protein n=1 Tax=Pseudozyma hubeiensis (strain SY62) TaxID=1305764 RepID=R9P5G5_PSEHS|nr:hypothetical protein PHSY_004189 [Pseudozyma hubeiensis SY62]GAC96606.1 hypothetical protein PHSY_004189 [Pseudozyma hubeiensis SY62]